MVNINEKIDEGHIHTRIILEVLGKPKEHIEESIKKFVDSIKQNPNFEVIKDHVAESKEVDDGMWSTFAELEMLFKDVSILIGFCFDYMPSSVEIIAPETISFKRNALSNTINDLQAKLHDVDMKVKQLNNQNQFLKANLNTSLKNLILLLINSRPLNLKELENFTGLEEKGLEPLLKDLVKDNLIKLEDNKYSKVQK